MENEKDTQKLKESDKKNSIIEHEEEEVKKVEILTQLIIRIVVSSTLKEYYETCNKILKIQPDRSK